ncbi:MAG: alpha/beta fold hydrolase, partial [Fidelibacterota bacterium]
MPLDGRYTYRAPIWARSPMTQTGLGRSHFRRRGPNPMLDASKEEIILTSEEVRLQGFDSKQDEPQSRGLVVLLPGWEGSANSTYMVCMGRILYKAGYDVYRLNYRDHGHTHHLNEGMFHGALLQEVAEVVNTILMKSAAGRVFIVGFSLGGNFALRLA